MEMIFLVYNRSTRGLEKVFQTPQQADLYTLTKPSNFRVVPWKLEPLPEDAPTSGQQSLEL